MHAQHQHRLFNLRQSIPLLLLLASVGACVEREPAAKKADRDAAMIELSISRPSANYLILPTTVSQFRAGKTRDDLLKDIQWHGNFYVAGQYNGNAAAAIGYELVLPRQKEKQNAEGEWLIAIFITDKFDKFVKWLPGEMEVVDYKGTPWSRPKATAIGDIGYLIRAIASKPVSIADVEQEIKARPPTPSQIDPGLTIAYLLLRGTSDLATAEDYKRNAEFRNQYNAARLNVGMTEAEVEAVFQAKPIASGQVKAGAYKVYGSDASFNIDSALRYSNVLIVFKEDRASVIYGIEGGPDWREKAKSRFSDFSILDR